MKPAPRSGSCTISWGDAQRGVAQLQGATFPVQRFQQAGIDHTRALSAAPRRRASADSGDDRPAEARRAASWLSLDRLDGDRTPPARSSGASGPCWGKLTFSLWMPRGLGLAPTERRGRQLIAGHDRIAAQQLGPRRETGRVQAAGPPLRSWPPPPASPPTISGAARRRESRARSVVRPGPTPTPAVVVHSRRNPFMRARTVHRRCRAASARH